MKSKLFYIISFISLSSITLAYTQSDLLSAQTNYQNVKNNNLKLENNLQKAKQDQIDAESELTKSESRFIAAKKDLALKKESAILAQKAYESSNQMSNEAKRTVITIWNQLNGSK